MDQIWIAAAAGIAAVALGVPFVAIVLVSIASRREEAAHSLSRQAPGAAARAARRLLAFRTEKPASMPDRAASYASTAGRERRPSRNRRSGGGRRSAGPGPRPRTLGLVPSVPTVLAPGHDAIAAREVRFGHARRSLSDAGQYQAGRESQPRSVRADQRQGAGV
jgi:hypothetical protein